jgi:hypothetical protein
MKIGSERFVLFCRPEYTEYIIIPLYNLCMIQNLIRWERYVVSKCPQVTVDFIKLWLKIFLRWFSQVHMYGVFPWWAVPGGTPSIPTWDSCQSWLFHLAEGIVLGLNGLSCIAPWYALLYYFTLSNAKQFYSSSGECCHSKSQEL